MRKHVCTGSIGDCKRKSTLVSTAEVMNAVNKSCQITNIHWWIDKRYAETKRDGLQPLSTHSAECLLLDSMGHLGTSCLPSVMSIENFLKILHDSTPQLDHIKPHGSRPRQKRRKSCKTNNKYLQCCILQVSVQVNAHGTKTHTAEENTRSM
jgi:hypothetical protein